MGNKVCHYTVGVLSILLNYHHQHMDEAQCREKQCEDKGECAYMYVCSRTKVLSIRYVLVLLFSLNA